MAKKKTKFLYHTTGLKNLPSIEKYGLDPEKAAGWSRVDGKMIEARPIYLAVDQLQSEAYGSYFEGQRAVVLQIDVSQLDKDKLGPDDVDLPGMLDQEGDDREWNEVSWEESLKICGQCTYDGVIPPSAIRPIKEV